MRIRMITNAAGPDFQYSADKIYAVENSIAKNLIDGRYAVQVDADDKDVPSKSPPAQQPMRAARAKTSTTEAKP